MLQNNKTKIMRLFFDAPSESFHIRQISRKTGIATTSVRKYIDALLKEGMITAKKGIYISYKAERESDAFRFYKKIDTIERIHSSGLLDYIYNSCSPDSIILFGSSSRGEDNEESDMDLFIQAKEKKLNLEKFEKIFSRKITPFFEENFPRLSNELKNNILNGIVLKGYIKVF